MNSSNSKLLFSRYPEMFKNAHDLKQSLMGFGFECGDGWFNLINTLLAHAYYPVGQLKHKLEELPSKIEENPEGPPSYYGVESWGKYEEKLRKELKIALKNLPVLVQVKEKFGTLRIYTHGGDSAFQAQIELAESLSGQTCEECGAPGFRAGPGWIRTLCAEHFEERHGAERLVEVAQAMAAASILEEYFKGADFLKKESDDC